MRAATSVSHATPRHDAVKNATGRGRHLPVDARGLPVMMMVTLAGVHVAHAAR
ncbi:MULTISPECIES: hypothetical protein [Streptomyces]|uniref:Transposase n=1 Tax=Streptomyces pilosus TaxID=28893 RepID=A0A918C8L1_9ACTN|nr:MULTISPECIES: hypothetical protein [Streptomyces]WQC17116.1 hypothetical protein TR631_36900 [Streptomyces rochei]GGR11054.1 hypothetical protein GCM10010280_68180 [Streptomyces pilosus]